ncbi:MAG TPA: FGGY family carbohydrate kinase [Cytophagaceae bacterium]|jgi:sugar (pentulose or hexulose) kinase
MTPCVAVFDIGKTNKKFILFDESYNIVKEIQINFEEVKDDEGENCEDLRALTEWMLHTWKEIQGDESFDIIALNFTTYGASFVHLDEDNKPVGALYNYLKPFPLDLEERFFNAYGPRLDFATITASPNLGMLNSGLQIYWLKYKHPHTFARVKTSLHFPQYCSFLFTGRKTAEFTSIGCHTAMWNMVANSYHEWLSKEEIGKLLPPISTDYHNGTASYKGKDIPVGTGLHDSSAALIPYLSKIKDKFILLSTGTWCITLNPFAENNLTKDELEKDCLNYMTFEGRKVKASRLFLGNDHENFTKRFSGHFYKDKDYFKTVRLDRSLLQNIDTLPLIIQDKYNSTSIFAPADIDIFVSYEQAYHKLIWDMVQMQVISVKLASENSNTHKVLYVDGGFSKNDIFMTLLAESLPGIKVEAFELSQGTALGGALVMNAFQSAKV